MSKLDRVLLILNLIAISYFTYAVTCRESLETIARYMK